MALKKGTTPKEESKSAKRDRRLYTLRVELIGGPVTGEFFEDNPVVSRTIQIPGDQKLQHLHYAIFDAFGRDDEHMYEFQFGGKKPHDKKCSSYILPEAIDDYEPRHAGLATKTTIGELGLKVKQVFFYWFDFGDDWWHEIKVVSIADETPKGKYPKITEMVGECPPQYADWDEEEE